jgi:4-amino-4-deoxy-L-arabinose transferase-like glycosyltransferase
LWALFVTILAFLLRGVATDRIPIFLTGDEGSSGITSANFIKGEWNNIFTTGWFSFPSFFSFLQSLSIRVFGQSIAALRIPSALIGALTVAGTYLCGKKMFGQRAGLLAALFLSAFHFHIHFSRIGLNNIWDGFWYVSTLGALWYGWQYESRKGYVVAGLGLGFAQYFYSSSRMLFGIILIGVILAAVFQRARLRQAWSHLIVMGLLACAIVLPLACFYIKEPVQFTAPFQRVSILGGWLDQRVAITGEPAWQILLKQIGTGFQAYTLTPILFWYAPEIPLLQPIGATLFYLGLLFFIFQDTDSRFVILALWLLAFGFIGGFSESAPASQRYVAAAPVCALVVGYGLHKSAQVGEQLWPKLSKMFMVSTYVIMLLVMVIDLKFYFFEYTPKSEIQNMTSNGTIAQYIANYLQSKPDGVPVAFLGSPNMGYHSIPSIQYLAPQVAGINIAVPWAGYDHSGFAGPNIVFIFLPERQAEILPVMQAYPNGLLKVQQTRDGQILFWIYDYFAKR